MYLKLFRKISVKFQLQWKNFRAFSSINVTNNQNSLNDEIVNVKSISIEINSILDSIKSIADETKMLGLNAGYQRSLESGEAGRGFGVDRRTGNKSFIPKLKGNGFKGNATYIKYTTIG